MRTHGELFSKSYQMKPNLDCNYTFSIDFRTKQDSTWYQINRIIVNTVIRIRILRVCTKQIRKEYDSGDSFPIDYEPNGIRFGS